MGKIFFPQLEQHPSPSAGTHYPLAGSNNPLFNQAPPAPSSLYSFGPLSLTPFPQGRQMRQSPTTAGQGLQPTMETAVPMQMSLAAGGLIDPTPISPVQFVGPYDSIQMQPSYNVNAYPFPETAGLWNRMSSTQPHSTRSSSPMYAGDAITSPIFPYT